MDYGNILTTTWKTIWKEKSILWFGMLMMIAPALLGFFMGGVFAFSTPDKLESFFSSSSFEGIAAIFFFLAYFLFIIISVLASALSFSGTFKGVLLAQKNTEPLTFSDLWDASLPYLWRMLGVMFTVGAALALVYFVPLIFLVLVGALTAGIGFLCAMPFFLLMIPLGLVGYLLLSLSMAALVAEDTGVFEAIQQAWAVLKAKFWALVLMTVILYILQMAIGFIIAIPMNIIPFTFIIPMEAGGEINPETLFRYVGIFMGLFIPIVSILQSLGITFVNGAWMLSYLEASAPATLEENDIQYA